MLVRMYCSHVEEERMISVARLGMHFDRFSFGSIQIDGNVYQHDVVIDRGEIRNARRSHPRNFESSSATLRFR